MLFFALKPRFVKENSFLTPSQIQLVHKQSAKRRFERLMQKAGVTEDLLTRLDEFKLDDVDVSEVGVRCERVHIVSSNTLSFVLHLLPSGRSNTRLQVRATVVDEDELMLPGPSSDVTEVSAG